MNYAEKKYPDAYSSAVAFRMNFHRMAFGYDSLCASDFDHVFCPECYYSIQAKDFLMPRANVKAPFGALTYYGFFIVTQIKDKLIDRFDDITDEDFRPIRSKKGDIVCYQVCPRNVLPPIAAVNESMKSYKCPECGRVGWRGSSKEEVLLRLSPEAIEALGSLNQTFERPLHSTQGSIIVSKEVHCFLNEICPKPRMEFVPVLAD